MNKVLCKLHSWKPKEFVRPPRSLIFLPRWEATEFRQFLLYTGIVVLLEIKQSFPHLYQNFLKLHVGIFIMCSSKLCKDASIDNYASSVLTNFVKDYARNYGLEYVSHNVDS